MKFLDAGRKLIEEFEGFQPKAYLDIGLVPSIGYGFTQAVNMGDTMTYEEADIRLAKEIKRVCGYVTARLNNIDLTDHQFTALCCLTYNIGITRLASSTLLKLVLAEDMTAAAEEFPKWDKCAGQIVPGLLRRRLAEQAMFCTPD